MDLYMLLLREEGKLLESSFRLGLLPNSPEDYFLIQFCEWLLATVAISVRSSFNLESTLWHWGLAVHGRPYEFMTLEALDIVLGAYPYRAL